MVGEGDVQKIGLVQTRTSTLFRGGKELSLGLSDLPELFWILWVKVKKKNLHFASRSSDTTLFLSFLNFE